MILRTEEAGATEIADRATLQVGASLRKVTADLMDFRDRRSQQSMLDARGSISRTRAHDGNNGLSPDPIDEERAAPLKSSASDSKVTAKISAVLLACMMNFMISIPFGAAYFPVGWQSQGSVGSGPNRE